MVPDTLTVAPTSASLLESRTRPFTSLFEEDKHLPYTTSKAKQSSIPNGVKTIKKTYISILVACNMVCFIWLCVDKCNEKKDIPDV